MGDIETDRPAQSHEIAEAQEVVHQTAVAEGRAALREHDLVRTGILELRDDVPHLVRRQELSLLDIHRTAGRRTRHEQVGLPAQEGRDLQDRRDLATGPAWAGSWTSVVTGTPSASPTRASSPGPPRDRGRGRSESTSGSPCRSLP